MAIDKMTLIGMENYFATVGDTLFKYLRLPSDYDKETAVDTILMRGGEFPVLWANPEFVQLMIGVWSAKQYDTFERWMIAWKSEFNPIHNYDRYEEWQDKRNSEHSANNTTTDEGTTTSSAEDEANTTNTTNVSAFDASTLQPREQTVGETTGSSNTEGTSSNTRQEERAEDTSEESEHTAHIYGNIGVTTSTAMLTEYVNFFQDYNVYEMLADAFIKEFCLMIY